MSMLFFQLKLIERLSRGKAIQWIPPVACKGLKIHSILPLLLSGFLSPTLQAYATWLRLILQAPNVLNLQAFAHAVPSTCNATPVFACPQLNILHGSGCVTSFFFSNLAKMCHIWHPNFLSRVRTTAPAVGVWSLNHWTPGKSPCHLFCEGLPHPKRQAHASFAPHPGASPYGEVHSGAYIIFTCLPPPLMSISLLRAWTMHLSKPLKTA